MATGAPPRSAVAPVTKSEPVMVTVVPPSVTPPAGAMPVTTGGLE